MFHYHPLISWKTELEIAAIGSKRMRFFNPVLDKRTARSYFRNDFLPNLVNVNRLIWFGAGRGGLQVRCRRFVDARAAAGDGLPVAQGVQIFDHFVERCLAERLDRADHGHLEM